MQVHDTTNDRVTAELIFTGGKVHTVNARNDIIEAVAVGDRAIMQTLNAMA
jgi:predicted amidohydrolase YtcJ